MPTGPNNKNDNKLQQKQKSVNWGSIKLYKQHTKNTKKDEKCKKKREKANWAK